MPSTVERVDPLERALASFMERSEEALLDIRASVAEIRASNARTDAELRMLQQQADRGRERADRERTSFNKRMAELSDSMGTLIEDMVAPNGFRIFGEIFPGEPLLESGLRFKRHHPSDRSRVFEIDFFVVGAQHVLIVEAKRRMDASKTREFREQVTEFGAFFPEYAGHRVVEAVASVYLDPSIVTYLNRQKIYGIAMGDDTMEVVNAGAF